MEERDSARYIAPSWVSELFATSDVDEVLINGCQSVLILGQVRRSEPSPFSSDRELTRELQAMAHRQGLRLDPMQPAAGGLVFDQVSALQLRWHALLPPIARDGPLASFRRHRLHQLQIDDFVPPSQQEQLLSLIEEAQGIYIVGPTGAGKTSLLIALLRHIAEKDRVAILEHVPEIPRLAQPWIRLCSQGADFGGEGAFSLSQVFDELLRLRPDRVVVGELRQHEAVVLKRSLLAGHGGVWCTLHADGPERLPWRLAELSEDAKEVWDDLLEGSVVLVMQREKPRLREAWMRVHESRSWRLIFSAKERSPPKSCGTDPQESSELARACAER